MVHHTGWPMFLLPHGGPASQEVDGVIECWLRPADSGVNRPLGDPPIAISGAWRRRDAPLSSAATRKTARTHFRRRPFLTRRSPSGGSPKPYCTPKICRACWQTTRRASPCACARFTRGLAEGCFAPGPRRSAHLLVEGGAARSDEAMLETAVPVREIETDLARHLPSAHCVSFRALRRDRPLRRARKCRG